MIFQNVKVKDVKLTIGQTVRMLRKREKLSQQQLGDYLNLSRITIQNLEGGKNFTIDTLLLVLQHFDLLKELNESISTYKNDRENVPSLF